MSDRAHHDGTLNPPWNGLLRHFETVPVHFLRVLEGSGSDDDPYRHVSYWIHPDGRLIMRHDPHEDAS